MLKVAMIFRLITTAIIFICVPFIVCLADDDEENPHTGMVEDEFVCLECHTDIPKEGETSPTFFLVDDPSEHCLGCHDETRHPGTIEHQGQNAEPMLGDENGEIACFTCHDPHPEGVLKDRNVYRPVTNEYNEKFIKVVVAPGVKEKVKNEIRINENKDVYLRESTDKLCITCHEDNKKSDWRKHSLWNKFTGLFSY